MKKKRRARIGYKPLFVVLQLLLIGSIWQSAMRGIETREYGPIGRTYTVGGHDAHMYGAGAGPSTVVFLAGAGTPSAYTDFYYLQNELKPYFRTISYDRPGFGWSKRTDAPRTIDTVAEELRELLRLAGEQPPYTLVGHSLASLEAIRYAQLYPHEVKGVMLLDGGSPEYYAEDSEMKSYAINRAFAALRTTGIVRALGAVGVKLPITGESIRSKSLPLELRKLDAAMYYNHVGDSANLDVIKHINENARTVIEGGPLRGIPLRIVSADSGGQWEQVQKQLLLWSDRSQQVTLPYSDHYIHWSNRETVVAQIKEMIETAVAEPEPESESFPDYLEDGGLEAP